MTYLIGIDASKWDPILRWENYTWDFAFVKAMEGEVPDPKFLTQWRAAEGYTIRGPYFWFHWFNDQGKVVRMFRNVLGNDPGELPPVLDLEDDDGEPNKVPLEALEWCKECKNVFGKKPIIYTSWGFANRVKLFNFVEFAEYDIWLAGYPWDQITETWTEAKRDNQIFKVLNNHSLYPYPSFSPKPFNAKPIWTQWTAKCKPDWVPGYPLGDKKAVDINFCYLTMPQLFERYKIVYTPKGDDMSTKPITMTADLKSLQPSNLRNAPGTVGTTVFRTMTGPLTIKGTGEKIQKDGFWWIEIVATVDSNGEKPVSGWVALTTAYENIIWLNPSPSPTRKVVKNVTYFDDNTTVETFPRP